MITRAQIRAAIKLARRGALDLRAWVDSVARDYVQAQAELEGLVLEALLKGDLGQIRARQAALVKMHVILDRLARSSPAKVRALAREAWRLGERTTRVGTGESMPEGFGRMRQEGIDLVTENLENRLGDARVTVGRRVEDVIRREGLRAAAMAVGDNSENIAAASAAYRDRLLKQGITAFVDKAGRNWNLDTYATMAVRTGATDTMAEGAQATLLARGFDLVEVHSGETYCHICEPFQGGPWSLTGRASDVSRLERIPSYHPHCDCVITPHRDAFAEREAWRAQEGVAA